MTQTRFKKVPFDLELAKKITNKQVKGRIVAENGFTAKIICFDYKMKGKRCNIIALIEFAEYEDIITCGYDGKYNRDYFNRELALHIEVPTYYKDYSNFKPCTWQPVLVRNLITDMWLARVATGERTEKGFGINSVAGEYKFFTECLPISKLTINLLGTSMSYDELLEEKWTREE